MNTTTAHALSLRTGVRRAIPKFEYRNLRLWALLRLGGAGVQAGCVLLILGFGGNDSKTYGWAALFFVLGALNFAGGYWELTIARRAARLA